MPSACYHGCSLAVWYLQGEVITHICIDYYCHAFMLHHTHADAQLPAWPFVAASFGVGIFALGPYFALWAPSREATAPPAPEELQGWRALGLKGTESRIGSWFILAGVVATVGQVTWRTCPHLLWRTTHHIETLHSIPRGGALGCMQPEKKDM